MNELTNRLTEVMSDLGLEKPVDLANFCGVSEGLVSQWFSGTTGLGPKPLRAFAAKTDYSLDWLTDGRLPKYRAAKKPDPVLSQVAGFHPDDPVGEDEVLVPESRIEFSGGSGRVMAFELVEDEEPAKYRRSWFQKYGINPERVRRFRVAGRSMEPMLFPRDTILVNTEETNIVDGRLYAIRYSDELRVKYLSRRLDGTLILRSVNPDYKDEEVPADLANEHISIIGRVRDRSGTGGL